MNWISSNKRLQDLIAQRYAGKPLKPQRAGKVEIDLSAYQHPIKSLVIDGINVTVEQPYFEGRNLLSAAFTSLSDGRQVFLKFLREDNTDELMACLDASELLKYEIVPGFVACIDAFIVDVDVQSSGRPANEPHRLLCIVLERGEVTLSEYKVSEYKRLAGGTPQRIAATIAAHALLLGYTYATYMGRGIQDPSCGNAMLMPVGASTSVSYIIDGIDGIPVPVPVPLLPGGRKLVVIDHGSSDVKPPFGPPTLATGNTDTNTVARLRHPKLVNHMDGMTGEMQARLLNDIVKTAKIYVRCGSSDNAKVIHAINNMKIRLGSLDDVAMKNTAPPTITVNPSQAFDLINISLSVRYVIDELMKRDVHASLQLPTTEVAAIRKHLEKMLELTQTHYDALSERLKVYEALASDANRASALRKSFAYRVSTAPAFDHRMLIMDTLLEVLRSADIDTDVYVTSGISGIMRRRMSLPGTPVTSGGGKSRLTKMPPRKGRPSKRKQTP